MSVVVEFLFTCVWVTSIAYALPKFRTSLFGQRRIIQTDAIEFILLQIFQIQERVVRTVNGADKLIKLDLQRL